MKTLACGELMAGCKARFTGTSEDEILAQAGRHVAEDHKMAVTPELVEAVRAKIRDAGNDAGRTPDTI